MNRIALVTTCLNEGDSIRLWMEDVAAQTVRPTEIVIVDAGSRDGTLEALREWKLADCQVRVEEIKWCSVARGRNQAIALTTANIIVSTDTGCRLAPTWVAELTAPFQTETKMPDVVAGNYAADPATLTSAAAWADFYLKNQFQNSLVPGFRPSSRSIAYRREVWELLGGYPEDLRYAGDDTVFAEQIYAHKLTMSFAPRAMAYWRRHHTFRKYLKEAFNYGRGNGEAGLRCGPILPVTPDTSLRRCYLALACVQTILSRSLLKSSLLACRQGRLGAAMLIPVMRAAAAYHFNLGYHDGRRHGDRHCRACRSRLDYPALSPVRAAA